MTIFGWDMSHFDDASIGSAVTEGIVFITHKAGGDANDAELSSWWSGVKNLGDNVLLGAYWVLYPGSPASRADQFIARLDAQCPGWRDRPFILQADCEKWSGNQSTVPSKSDIETFCDRLVDRMPKLRPIVYAPVWVYGQSLAGLSYPLWASQYVSGSGGFKSLYPGDSSSKWSSYSGQTPAILQYTSSATIGGKTTCDANAFRGTLDQLKARVAPGWMDNMEPIDVWNVNIGTTTSPYTAHGAVFDAAKRTDNISNNLLPALSDDVDDVKVALVALTQQVAALQTSETNAVSLLQALAARPDVDETQLAADLSASLIPHLPAGAVDATSLSNAFKTLFTQV